MSINWELRNEHFMMKDGKPRDLPLGIETLDIYLNIDLDKVAPDQVIVGSEWLGTPEQKKLRAAWEEEFLALRYRFDEMNNRQVRKQLQWFDEFHRDGAVFDTISKQKQQLLEMVLQHGDVDFHKHILEEGNRYGVEVEKFFVFSFGKMEMAYKPHNARFPKGLWNETENEAETGKHRPPTITQKSTKAATSLPDKRYEVAQKASNDFLKARKAYEHAEKAWEKALKAWNTLNSIDDACNWLEAHKDIGPFLKPLSDDEAPGYSKKIKQPMSISILRECTYRSNTQFIKNVRLIFDNCRLYNRSGSHIIKLANKIEADLILALRNSPKFSHALRAYPTFAPDYKIQPAPPEQGNPVPDELCAVDTTSKAAGDAKGANGSDNAHEPFHDTSEGESSTHLNPDAAPCPRDEVDTVSNHKRTRVEDSENEDEDSFSVTTQVSAFRRTGWIW